MVDSTSTNGRPLPPSSMPEVKKSTMRGSVSPTSHGSTIWIPSRHQSVVALKSSNVRPHVCDAAPSAGTKVTLAQPSNF